MSLAGYLEPGYPPRQTKSRRKHPRAQRQPWGSCHHLPPFIAGGVYPCCESCTQETRATACAGANLDVKGGSGAITPPGPKQQFVPKPGLNTLHLLSLNPAGPGGHLAALWAQVGVMWGLLLAGGGSHKSLSPPSSGVPGEVGWGSLLGLWAWRGAGCGDPWG